MKFIAARRTFYLTNDPAGPHLWFVLTDPDPKAGHVVGVRVVTRAPHTDKTVVLHAGCHPFITHESNVDYGSATFYVARKLEAAIHAGHCTLHQDMSKQLLVLVRVGLLASARTANYLVDHCRPIF